MSEVLLNRVTNVFSMMVCSVPFGKGRNGKLSMTMWDSYHGLSTKGKVREDHHSPSHAFKPLNPNTSLYSNNNNTKTLSSVLHFWSGKSFILFIWPISRQMLFKSHIAMSPNGFRSQAFITIWSPFLPIIAMTAHWLGSLYAALKTHLVCITFR